MGVVVFNYPLWAKRYPELGNSISAEVAQLYFDEATVYCDNSPTSPVCDLALRQVLLFMVTAHIAVLNAMINGEAPTSLVGRISSATEGSVSVSADYKAEPGNEQWWAQTKPGAAFWAGSAQYRQAVYVAPCDPYISDPWAALIYPPGTL